MPTIARGAMWQTMANTTIDASGHQRRILERRLHAIGACRAPKFWPATGATAKPSATTGMNPA